MRDFAHHCLLGYFFWVLTITYSQDATRDIDAKYVKRRGFAQGCVFLGSQNQNLIFTPPFPQKPPFWGPSSTELGNFRLKNIFNIGGAKSKPFAYSLYNLYGAKMTFKGRLQ